MSGIANYSSNNAAIGVQNSAYPGLTSGSVQNSLVSWAGVTSTNKSATTNVRGLAGMKFPVNFSGMWGIESATLTIPYWQNQVVGDGNSGLDIYASNRTSIYTVGAISVDWWNNGAIFSGGWDTKWSPNVGVNWNTFVNYHTVSNQQLTVDTSAAGNKYLTFDVTAIVAAWYAGAANYGIRVGLDSHNSAAFADFVERCVNVSLNDANLSITYTTNTSPDAPELNYPISDNIVLGSSPVLSANPTDVDPGDWSTAWNLQVVSDDCTNPDVATAAQKFYAKSIGGQKAYGTINTTYGDGTGMYWYQPLVPGRYYKWRFSTQDKAGVSSPWSTLGRFFVNFAPNKPVAQISPQPLDDVTSASPQISFDFVDEATNDNEMHSYRVLCEKRVDGAFFSDYDSYEIDLSADPQASYTHTIPGRDWDTTYRARVAVKDEFEAWSVWSDWVEFTTHQTETAKNLSPDGDLTGYTPTFVGYRYGVIDTIEQYEIEVRNAETGDVLWAPTTFTNTAGSTSFTKLYAGLALTAQTQYYWQVRINSAIGGWSDWSAQKYFTVDDPTVPQIVSPIGDEEWPAIPTIAFGRTDTFDAVQYQVYYADARNVDSGVDDTGTDAHFHSGTITTGITGGNAFSQAYAGTGGSILAAYDAEFFYDPGTNLQPYGSYRLRARVSDDTGSTWSNWCGLVSFQTDDATPPILVSVNDNTGNPAWITSEGPWFDIQATGGDSIGEISLRICDATHNTDNPIWESQFVVPDVGAGTGSAYHIYDGNPDYLQPGYDYTWDARIEDTTDARSDWSGHKTFVINSPPDVPFGLSPPDGGGWNADDGNLIITAYFNDRDAARFGDKPAVWEIEMMDVLTEGGTQSDTMDLTDGVEQNLYAGINTVAWNQFALVDEREYMWRTRFSDQKGEWSLWTLWQTFIQSTPPNPTMDFPLDNTTIKTITPLISWELDPDVTQGKYMVQVQQTLIDRVSPIGGVTTFGPYEGAADTFQMPGGILRNGLYYNIIVTTWNTFGLPDPTPLVSNVDILMGGPGASTFTKVQAVHERSHILLEWVPPDAVAGVQLTSYRIYRKKRYKSDWVLIHDEKNNNKLWHKDYYAGNSTEYTYMIVSVGYKVGVGVIFEGATVEESFYSIQNASDNWTVVGADRQDSHIYDMIVVDESHNRPIQQEEFETLGSDRKVIMRGFVLGHEGSITALWTNTQDPQPDDLQNTIKHTSIGRDLIEYLTFEPGPHIIKSPFGDVWDAEITTPEYKWLSTGHLETTFGYVETGKTSPREDAQYGWGRIQPSEIDV